MSVTLLPELATESVETAERLVRLSAEENLAAAEAAYILALGLAAIQRVPRLWPIIKREIGLGMTATNARWLLVPLLDAVDKYLFLAAKLKDPARLVGPEVDGDLEGVADLGRAEEQLRAIRAEAVRLLRVLDAPAQWPAEEQLREAKERMRNGDRLSAEAFRQAVLGE